MSEYSQNAPMVSQCLLMGLTVTLKAYPGRWRVVDRVPSEGGSVRYIVMGLVNGEVRPAYPGDFNVEV